MLGFVYAIWPLLEKELTDQGDKNTPSKRDFFGGDGMCLKGCGACLASGTSGEARRITGKRKPEKFGAKSGGETGIRTLGGREPSSAFETDAFNHSAISPNYH